MWDAARPAPCDAAEPSDLAHPAPLPIPPACARLGPLGPGMRRPSALHACQDPPSIRRRGGLSREPGLRWTVHMAGMRGRGAGKRTFCAGRACQWLPDPGARPAWRWGGKRAPDGAQGLVKGAGGNTRRAGDLAPRLGARHGCDPCSAPCPAARAPRLQCPSVAANTLLGAVPCTAGRHAEPCRLLPAPCISWLP